MILAHSRRCDPASVRWGSQQLMLLVEDVKNTSEKHWLKAPVCQLQHFHFNPFTHASWASQSKKITC